MVNAIHIGPHLGSPQATIDPGYFGNNGYLGSVTPVQPEGLRSKIEGHKDKKKGRGRKTKKWLPYGLGNEWMSGKMPYIYDFPINVHQRMPPYFVRCMVPKGKNRSAKRCFGYGGGDYGVGHYGGLGPYGIGLGFPGYGYPGYGYPGNGSPEHGFPSYFPGFIDRPFYPSAPGQKSAKKTAKRWLGDGFGYGGLGVSPWLGVGLFPGFSQLIGYPGFGYGIGSYGYPYGLCKSKVPKRKGKGKGKNGKRCFSSYLDAPYLSYGLANGAGIPGYGLGYGLGYGYGYGLGYGYPGLGYPFGFYRSKVPKRKKKNSSDKIDRKQIIGFHPSTYAGVTGKFYPSPYPTSYSYGYNLATGVPLPNSAGFGPNGLYRSKVTRDKANTKTRDEDTGHSQRRQVIGSTIGGNIHGDGQGWGYPVIGDYGFGGYSEVPFGLGGTGFGIGLGLGQDSSTMLGSNLVQGGFGGHYRSSVRADKSSNNEEKHSQTTNLKGIQNNIEEKNSQKAHDDKQNKNDEMRHKYGKEFLN